MVATASIAESLHLTVRQMVVCESATDGVTPRAPTVIATEHMELWSHMLVPMTRCSRMCAGLRLARARLSAPPHRCRRKRAAPTRPRSSADPSMSALKEVEAKDELLDLLLAAKSQSEVSIRRLPPSEHACHAAHDAVTVAIAPAVDEACGGQCAGARSKMVAAGGHAQRCGDLEGGAG